MLIESLRYNSWVGYTDGQQGFKTLQKTDLQTAMGAIAASKPDKKNESNNSSGEKRKSVCQLPPDTRLSSSGLADEACYDKG